MNKCQKRTSLLVSLSLIITFAFLINANFARAEEMEGILPSQGIDIVTLWAGQNQTVKTSQVISSGIKSIGVISIGNKSLKAELTMTTKEVTGFWWILLIGTSTTNGIDFGYGLTYPSSGLSANVILDLYFGLGLAIGGVNATSSVSVAEPIKYSIKITGTAL